MSITRCNVGAPFPISPNNCSVRVDGTNLGPLTSSSTASPVASATPAYGDDHTDPSGGAGLLAGVAAEIAVGGAPRRRKQGCWYMTL